jgi:hypothetical protein
MVGLVTVTLLLTGCLDDATSALDEAASPAAHDGEPVLLEVNRTYAGSYDLAVRYSMWGGYGFNMEWPEVDFPDAFESGTFTFTWDGVDVGGVEVHAMKHDDIVHVFEVDDPELTVDLEANDARVHDINSLRVWPQIPGASAEVTWEARFTFLVADAEA